MCVLHIIPLFLHIDIYEAQQYGVCAGYSTAVFSDIATKRPGLNIVRAWMQRSLTFFLLQVCVSLKARRALWVGGWVLSVSPGTHFVYNVYLVVYSV